MSLLPAPRPPTRTLSQRFAVRWLVCVLRVILFALCLQLGGAANVAASLDERCLDERGADERGCCSDCPAGGSFPCECGGLAGLGCPPGCVLCHCHQTGAARLPRFERPVLLRLPAGRDVVKSVARSSTRPRTRFLSAVYRPPRPLMLSV